jgi:hypothetical protein
MNTALLALLFIATQSEVTATPLSLFKNVNNTDITTAGVGGMRDVGNADLSLGGIPTAAVVSHAYLYWNGPTTGYANDKVRVNGVSVTGTMIGVSADNCWGYSETHTYRADVTEIVRVKRNGIYDLDNFGRGDVNTNGASLVVLFDDRDPSNDRNVWIFDGNDSTENSSHDAGDWNAVLPNITGTSSDATLELHVGDGQIYPDGELVVRHPHSTRSNFQWHFRAVR